MASAVDIRHSTASHSASPQKTSTQNPPASPRMNAVACEVPVVATGARPSEKGGQRELFTEDTTTALVFENGGVLRLSAKVDPGQLLFLTHKETKREVVAQVTRKRDFRPGICYVEIEFSEPSPGFWNVKFPETPALAVANAQQEAAEGSAQALEDIIADEPLEPVTAPSDEEVTALKIEVEVLREQLKLLQTQPAPANSSLPAQTPQSPQASTGVPAQAPSNGVALGELLAKLQPATGDAAQEPPAELSGALESAQDAPAANPPMPDDGAKPSFSAQDILLPKPALNFKNAKPPALPERQQEVVVIARRAALRKDLLFAAFVLIVAGAAWYQNLLPLLPHPKTLFSSAPAPNVTAHPVSHTPQKAAAVLADSAKAAQPTEAPATSPQAALPNASQPAPLGTTKPSTPAASETPTVAKSGSDAEAGAAVAPEKPEAPARSRKHSASPPSSKAALDPEARPSDGAATVPPKLIKSVRAVARPDVLQDFSTGNTNSVTFDALVDASGHVKSMKALSGSAALQKAAIEALRQYRYEPATRGGKPVPARIKVTVNFLFEP
ncbi:MAG: TonB family protein [Candidatus Acidiferrum sp.]